MSVATRLPASRDRIRRAAARLFTEEGYQAVTMRAIAGRLDMTAAGLYAHYPSKSAILADFVDSELERFIGAVEAGVEQAGSDPGRRLRSFASAHVAQSLAKAELGPFNVQHALRQLTAHLPPGTRRGLLEAQRRHLGILLDILRDGVEQGHFQVAELTPTAFAILTMCDFVTNWYRPEGRLAPDQVADHHARLVLRMVGAEEE